MPIISVLRPNVMAMSVGRIGHVANAIRDEMEEMENIVIVAGQNDINAPYQNNHEFAYGVDKGMDKLLMLRENHPDKMLTFVHVQPPITANPRAEVRAKYIQSRLTSIQSE